MSFLIDKNIYVSIYFIREVTKLETARIFTNGGSQAVRLPKNCRFKEDEVLVNKVGNIVFLIPKDDRWSSMLAGLSLFTEDCFSMEAETLLPEEREPLQ